MLVSPSSLPLDPLSSLWIKPTFRVTRRMATGLFRHFDRHEVSTTERSAKGVGRVEFVPVECNHVNVTTMMLTTRKLPRLKYLEFLGSSTDTSVPRTFKVLVSRFRPPARSGDQVTPEAARAPRAVQWDRTAECCASDRHMRMDSTELPESSLQRTEKRSGAASAASPKRDMSSAIGGADTNTCRGSPCAISAGLGRRYWRALVCQQCCR